MNSLFYHYLSFVLTVLFSGALALMVAVFHKTGNGVYRLLGVYFAALLLAELFARDVEIRGMIYTLLAKTFHNPSLPTALCYSVMAVALAELARCWADGANTRSGYCAPFSSRSGFLVSFW